MSSNCCLEESLCRYIGQTVTIFTTSGGCSGSGFTGVLAFVGNGCVKLITSIGAAPACALGSSCCCGNHRHHHGGCGCENEYREEKFEGRRNYRDGNRWNWGWSGRYHYCEEEKECDRCECNNGGWNNGWQNNNWLGSVTEIPIDRIASFTHNAI